MKFPERGKIEWNLNTIIMVIGFIIGILVYGITIGIFVSKTQEADTKFSREIARIDERSNQRRSETEQRWRDHDQLHKDRAADNAAKAAKDEERFRNIENEVRKIDQLTYRLTVQEQGAANLTKSVEELKVTVNGQASDLRVIREILQRLDPGPRTPRELSQ